MTGPLVVERIRALHPEISAFCVSGYTNTPAAQKIVEEGASLTQKPISRSDFMKMVDASFISAPIPPWPQGDSESREW